MKGKKVAVVGGGREAELKAAKLLDAGASITVVAPRFTKGIEHLSRSSGVKLVYRDTRSAVPILLETSPLVVFICTGRPRVDEELAKIGRSTGALVCVVDTPRLNDFNMPAIAKIGEFRVAISTAGRSPAMAKVLRTRIEKIIRPEDVLQGELQSRIRGQIGRSFPSRRARKEVVYKVIRDKEVARLLRLGDIDAAKIRAKKIIHDSKWSSKKAHREKTT